MRKRSLLSFMLGIITVAALLLGGYTFFKDLDGPSVEISPSTDRLSPASILKIHMKDPSGIRAISVGVRKNNNLNVIFRKHFDTYLPEQDVTVSMKEANLREGAFELEIRATDASLAGFGQGNTRTLQMPMRLDTQPPRISVKTLPPNVRRGGTAVIRYTIDEDVSDTGVIVAGYKVPAYLQKDGSYICFFPFPYTLTARDYKNSVEITATDVAGNSVRNRLTVMALERNFKSDRIQITDNFLHMVTDKLHNLAPETTTPLECYLQINSNVRSSNAQRLREIGQDTVSGILWEGAFVRLPRSAPRAGYGDHRFFSYQGKQVGESFHLGLDLASVMNAEVPAANSGRVIFCGEVGIYGNLVVVDHGLGLMSLYAHLSDILVKQGDVVQKGQLIAHTGSTGLAFGDHLHFGILVGGVEVTPIEWLDPKWIRDNVTGRIQASMTQ
ncbi:MAG: M23 family metallopeptidase [Desulfovibrio sp.]|nr:M23 family metallopeptidase [Desulfovibrio sp.]